MPEFHEIDDGIIVCGQIAPADLVRAKKAGVTLIVNNRPDGEEPGQPCGQALAEEAAALGLRYVAIPVDHRGFGPEQVAALARQLRAQEGAALLFCRSGTRSALLWALASAANGLPADRIAAAVESAGYPVQPILGALHGLSRPDGV